MAESGLAFYLCIISVAHCKCYITSHNVNQTARLSIVQIIHGTSERGLVVITHYQVNLIVSLTPNV